MKLFFKNFVLILISACFCAFITSAVFTYFFMEAYGDFLEVTALVVLMGSVYVAPALLVYIIFSFIFLRKGEKRHIFYIPLGLGLAFINGLFFIFGGHMPTALQITSMFVITSLLTTFTHVSALNFLEQT